ncbi:MAG: sigma-70 family RNA polymerase sigma factor [Chloroflexi bacterium]|nr:sigma-70 family RNA polymerase sigma factor [Chloroflexota bacterium]
MSTNKTRAVPRVASAPEHPQFEDAFLANWQKVYRVLVRLVGDADEAQDLALETFWQLYREPPTRNPALNLGGWLYRVATNLGLNALRARKRRTRHEFDAGKWEIENHARDPECEAIANEERARVRAVLGAMDARQAQLLILRHSGASYKELATALEVSVNSIGTLLIRAEREFEKRYREREKDYASQ